MDKNQVQNSGVGGEGPAAEGSDCGTPEPVQVAYFDNTDVDREVLCQKLGNYDCAGYHLWLAYQADKHRYALLYRKPEGEPDHECSQAWGATLFEYDTLDELKANLATYDCGNMMTLFIHNPDKDEGQYELFVRNPGFAQAALLASSEAYQGDSGDGQSS
jgi:predicted lipoprotein with Yx(FWY)xxD motif